MARLVLSFFILLASLSARAEPACPFVDGGGSLVGRLTEALSALKTTCSPAPGSAFEVSLGEFGRISRTLTELTKQEKRIGALPDWRGNTFTCENYVDLLSAQWEENHDRISRGLGVDDTEYAQCAGPSLELCAHSTLSTRLEKAETVCSKASATRPEILGQTYNELFLRWKLVSASARTDCNTDDKAAARRAMGRVTAALGALFTTLEPLAGTPGLGVGLAANLVGAAEPEPLPDAQILTPALACATHEALRSETSCDRAPAQEKLASMSGAQAAPMDDVLRAMNAVDAQNEAAPSAKLSGNPDVDLLLGALSTTLTDSKSLKRIRLAEALKQAAPQLGRNSPLNAKVQALLTAFHQFESVRTSREAIKIDAALAALAVEAQNGALTTVRQAVEKLSRTGMRSTSDFSALRREEWEHRLSEQMRSRYSEAGRANPKAFLEAVRQPAYTQRFAAAADRASAEWARLGENTDASRRALAFEQGVAPLYNACSLWAALEGSQPTSKYLETCKPLLCSGGIADNGSRPQCQWLSDAATPVQRLRVAFLENGSICSGSSPTAFLRRAIDAIRLGGTGSAPDSRAR